MPGYFPKGGGWPAIAKTTPGVIRGTVYKHLDQYVPSMNDAILSQLRTLEFKDGGKSLSLWILVFYRHDIHNGQNVHSAASTSHTRW
jgi:hypothetical protein